LPDAAIRVYGALWCPDCRRAKAFLEEHGVPFEWIDTMTSEEGKQVVRATLAGRETIPLIFLPDGSFLVEPSDDELAGALGIGR
jgi:glutaredoxin